MHDESELRERWDAAGQGHVFRFWDGLDAPARSRFLAQLAAQDLEEVARLGALLAAPPALSSRQFEPPELFPLERSESEQARAREAREAGEELLRSGEVGLLLVAGGQGSRLGFDGPKGKFPVGPLTGRTLFGWHAARIQAARRRYGATLPWYIMTSAGNDAETRAYFEAEDYFGLGAENVRFFRQRMLPALSLEGRVLLADRDALFLAPGGHGGTLEALAESGCLAEAAERGIRRLSYFQVDSPLARPVDPLFLGLHHLNQAEMSSKVVAKRSPDEKVGVLGLAGGKLGCIEYSDLPDELRHARDDGGELLFRAGNIANHILDLAFVERLTRGGALRLPWHLARKSIPTLADDGSRVEVQGVKFETFIFDALGEARGSVTLEVDRRLEFQPIKNAEGEDSPASCRAALASIFSEWVAAAGGPAPPVGEDGVARIEIDPRLAEDRRTFIERQPLTPLEVAGGHLYQVDPER